MELTESEKKGLRRFSLLLESLSDDPWELNLWFDDASLSDSLHHNKYFSSNSASGNIEIDFFMEALLDNFLREIENNNMIYDYCSEFAVNVVQFSLFDVTYFFFPIIC